jgi:prolyl-tRNA editing enzyme YbaK/EbsC (Cys-tRNA(Pro) deacylase)
MDYHPVVHKLKDLLAAHHIKYEWFEHTPVRTSEEAAKLRPGYTLKQGAKALLVKLVLRTGRDAFVLLVVPGDTRFDTKKVKKLLDAKELRFATEAEVSLITGGVEVGGVPPFGSLFSLHTYLDRAVAHADRIVFNAGDKRVSIAMSVADYLVAEKPSITELV